MNRSMVYIMNLSISTMASNNRLKTGLSKLHSYLIRTYSERGHLGLPEYVFFEKSIFFEKNRLSDGGIPLKR